jgi:hypothetical protein
MIRFYASTMQALSLERRVLDKPVSMIGYVNIGVVMEDPVLEVGLNS